jgi:hypothetical protein
MKARKEEKSVLNTNELQIGDTVCDAGYESEPWSTKIVKNVTEKEVTFFRPYGTTADFSCTSGVICYIGLEEYSIPRDWPSKYTLYHRQNLK